MITIEFPNVFEQLMGDQEVGERSRVKAADLLFRTIFFGCFFCIAVVIVLSLFDCLAVLRAFFSNTHTHFNRVAHHIIIKDDDIGMKLYTRIECLNDRIKLIFLMTQISIEDSYNV